MTTDINDHRYYEKQLNRAEKQLEKVNKELKEILPMYNRIHKKYYDICNRREQLMEEIEIIKGDMDI